MAANRQCVGRIIVYLLLTHLVGIANAQYAPAENPAIGAARKAEAAKSRAEEARRRAEAAERQAQLANEQSSIAAKDAERARQLAEARQAQAHNNEIVSALVALLTLGFTLYLYRRTEKRGVLVFGIALIGILLWWFLQSSELLDQSR